MSADGDSSVVCVKPVSQLQELAPGALDAPTGQGRQMVSPGKGWKVPHNASAWGKTPGARCNTLQDIRNT